MRKHYKHLSIDDRNYIQSSLNENIAINIIAENLDVNITTIYREIKRGTTNGKYDAKYSQLKYEAELNNKGKEPILLMDRKLAEEISNYILVYHLSPEEITKKLKSEGIECPSVNTIYTAIDNGLIPNVTRNDLLNRNTTIYSKGIIQIPLWIREKLELKDGDSVNIDINENTIEIKKINT